MGKKRHIAIVGSRENVSEQAVRDFVSHLNPITTVIVSGGARGVDTWAVEAAEARGMRTVVIRPNWKKYGKSAGFRRNREIVAVSDDVAAFWDGKSRGTHHTMRTARKMNKNLAVFDGEGTLIEFVPAEETLETMAIPKEQS